MGRGTVDMLTDPTIHFQMLEDKKGDWAVSDEYADQEMTSSRCCYRGHGFPITYHVTFEKVLSDNK